MFEAIISGIILGGLLALLVGPVFFMLINTSIKKGFLPASMLALGVVLSDAFYVVLTFYGSTLLIYLKEYDHQVGIAGGILILIFGIFTFIKKPSVHADALEIVDDSKTRIIDIIKGFTMNTLNPSALLFWLGVAGTITVNHRFTGSATAVFYTATLTTVFCTDLLKSWIASRLKGIINARFLIAMNRISGVALGAYGIYMIVKFTSLSI